MIAIVSKNLKTPPIANPVIATALDLDCKRVEKVLARHQVKPRNTDPLPCANTEESPAAKRPQLPA